MCQENLADVQTRPTSQQNIIALNAARNLQYFVINNAIPLAFSLTMLSAARQKMGTGRPNN